MTGRHQISLLEMKLAADLTLQIPPPAAAVRDEHSTRFLPLSCLVTKGEVLSQNLCTDLGNTQPIQARLATRISEAEKVNPRINMTLTQEQMWEEA